MTEEECLEIGRHIWSNYVPKSGQSETVQGELLRACEKLRDEAHRNGNMNWDNGHEILARYIRSTVGESNDLSREAIGQLNSDIEIVLNYADPKSGNEVFDRIAKAIFDWYVCNEKPIPRAINPDLHR